MRSKILKENFVKMKFEMMNFGIWIFDFDCLIFSFY